MDPIGIARRTPLPHTGVGHDLLFGAILLAAIILIAVWMLRTWRNAPDPGERWKEARGADPAAKEDEAGKT